MPDFVIEKNDGSAEVRDVSVEASSLKRIVYHRIIFFFSCFWNSLGKGSKQKEKPINRVFFWQKQPNTHGQTKQQIDLENICETNHFDFFSFSEITFFSGWQFVVLTAVFLIWNKLLWILQSRLQYILHPKSDNSGGPNQCIFHRGYPQNSLLHCWFLPQQISFFNKR